MKNQVKLLALIALSTTFLWVTSCGKDDGPESPNEVVEQTKEEPQEEAQDPPKEEEQPTEETPSTEVSNQIAENVIIKGGTKVEGEPPTPNEAITLILPNVPTTGVLDEGFDIPLFSEADITGAYLQFKAVDGGISESYYDIDIAANQIDSNTNGKSAKLAGHVLKHNRSLTAKGAEGPLDIDLGAEIGPGEFCYIISAYDAAGNISATQEVCVTINAFGGDQALVGQWHLIRYEDTENGVTEIELIGEEYCFENNCQTEEYDNLTINADGTFERQGRFIMRDIDGAYGSEFDEYIVRGKWSYPSAADSDLVTVDYYYSQTDENDTEEETYTTGNSEVEIISSEEIEVTATELIITDRYDDDADGDFEEIYVTIYEKQ